LHTKLKLAAGSIARCASAHFGRISTLTPIVAGQTCRFARPALPIDFERPGGAAAPPYRGQCQDAPAHFEEVPVPPT